MREKKLPPHLRSLARHGARLSNQRQAGRVRRKTAEIAEIEGWINHLEAAIVNGAKQVAIETKKLKKAKTRTKKKKAKKAIAPANASSNASKLRPATRKGEFSTARAQLTTLQTQRSNLQAQLLSRLVPVPGPSPGRKQPAVAISVPQ